jgi:hypothetical protein
MNTEPQKDKDWRIETNDRYQKVVDTLITLATSALVLPAFFLREMLAIPSDQKLIASLNFKVFISWGALASAILLGIIFQYSSAKWVKLATGGKVCLSEKALCRLLDWTFWLMVGGFGIGLASLLWFMVTH